MIRVAIVAASNEQAHSLADLLSKESQFEVTEARTLEDEDGFQQPIAADVTVVAGLSPNEVGRVDGAIVMLSEDPGEESKPGREISAWIPFNSSLEELAAAISAAAVGLVILTSNQAQKWLHTQPDESDDIVQFEALTRRELEILYMLADGLANKEIAGKLEISDHTVKFHVSQILAKLGAGSRAEAVAIGIRRGLVPV